MGAQELPSEKEAAEEGISLEHLFNDLHPTSLAHTDPLTTPLSECFDWNALLKQHHDHIKKPRKFYVVAFRSVRSSDADDDLLYAADSAAYLEAKKSGGLLRYWYGTLNSRRECLASCIWESREASASALGGPAHIQAMNLAAKMYERYTFERYWLDILPSSPVDDNCSFSLKFIASTTANPPANCEG